uniref:Lipoprotein n=1 Tax=Acidobacterium capsulatum TaxID=33075 RepID=A0A7V4XRD8_9BACT
MLRALVVLTIFTLQAVAQANAQEMNAARVMQQLRISVKEMTSALPDITCHEQVTSTRAVRGKVRTRQHFEYLLTVTHPAKTGEDFPEQRKLLTFDGKPVRKGKGRSPVFSIIDGFGTTWSGVLAPEHAPCQIDTAREIMMNGEKVIELDVRVNPNALSLPACHGDQDDPNKTATFWISPRTGRLLRAHVHHPHGKVTRTRLLFGIPHSMGLVSTTHPYVDINIETHYSAVQFGPDLTVIPNMVDATVIYLKKPDVRLTYQAVNSDCHRFVATVKIVPNEKPTQ